MVDDPRALYARGLDAGLNRLAEALRTVEDRLRFDRSHLRLPARWRTLRHQLADLRSSLESDWGPLALWRDVESDPGAPLGQSAIGRTGPERTEPQRNGPDDLLGANLARAREASRSIEEALRAARPALAPRAEALRYAIYAAEAQTLGLLRRQERLRHVRLYVLLTTELASRPALEAAAAALAGGAEMIQLREKTLPNREFLPLARDLRELTAAAGALFIVNDRVEIAALCDADGVHQGQEDLPPGEVRKILGPDRIVGVSTHDPDQARRAESAGADYIGVGPVHETRTKEHRAAVGLGYIRGAAQAAAVPGFAIGGVNRSTLPSVLEAGARRIAVCTGIISEPDIEGSTRWFRDRLEAAGPLVGADDVPSL